LNAAFPWWSCLSYFLFFWQQFCSAAFNSSTVHNTIKCSLPS
jgi:hypothetical protein